MALKIRNAPGRPGFAHLEFDREINSDSLKIAIFNLIKREYLGHSVGKPNWTPARAHLFVAPLVERGGGRSVFLVGPEVTTFIPDEATVEITSEDNTVRERAVWSGILLDFHWKGPDVDTEAQTARIREEAVKKELEDEVRRQREEEDARRQREGEEARRRREEEARKLEEEARARRENEEKAAAEQRAAALAASKPRSYAKLLAIAAVVLITGMAAWGSQNRDLLCNRFGVLCDAETLAYRAADACARPKSCGADSCLADYRRDYPQGRFKEQINRISTEKGAVCVDPAELAAYNRAKACSDPMRCDAGACFVEYRRTYPNGPHKAEIDALSAAKGGACPVDLELQMFDRAKACASPKNCGANECLTEYRRSYPNGRFKAEIDRIAAAKGPDCRDYDREAYERADACARPLTCGANLRCLNDYRRSFPDGRFKAEIERIATAKGAECPDREQEAYERAETCARPLNCGANRCLTDYRRDYPAGRFKARIDALAAEKGADCPTPVDPLPPFNPRPLNQDTGFKVSCTQLQNPEPIEEMICADADFARENAELQRAFDLKIARLSPSDKTRLRLEERNWITRRDSECNIQRSGSWDQMALRRVKGCFIEKTRARRNELQ
jgi:uncharacterized protein YecT (DUF1311 family)